MPQSQNNKDLHGNVPDRSRTALLLVDVINDLDFPGNEEVVKISKTLGKSILALKKRCTRAGVPVIYVADNRGRWQSDSTSVVKAAMRRRMPGRVLTRILNPGPNDYIVLKPRHSAFYATPLQTILEYLGAKTLIIAGLATESCVMLAAGEAFVLDYQIIVPCDCVAGLNMSMHSNALRLMEDNLHADIRPWKDLNLRSLKSRTHR
ncbi:MAG TPA: cysteine hydrolase [Terriglobales bacterium]|jgi:nicotinamidase-related amidase|nr:cysteine hydrolase [Terriglobales bacterium]